MLEFEGLSKRAFLELNRGKLQAEIAATNAALDLRYSGAALDVTETDLWVLINCEAGLKGGHVDPTYVHSEGEYGPFPLPSNLTYWNGAEAPAWDAPMSLEVNIRQALLYFGALKNKVVTHRQGHTIYAGLFEVEGVEGNATVQARILAGVVHGYFSNARYRDRRAPINQLLRGYIAGEDLGVMMAATKYIHAGKPLITNRARNIEEALSWLAA
tara:strand:- start:253 stop:894 length:642 start_codon:yes stop_codon:yes gene_type:complete